MNADRSLVLSIARVVHEVNAAYCRSIGDYSQLPWEQAPAWQQASAVRGVEMHLANPDATPEDSHKSWLAEKEKDGWKYGEKKDIAAKTHPCMMAYASLPAEQRAKDFIFKGVVNAIAREQARP